MANQGAPVAFNLEAAKAAAVKRATELAASFGNAGPFGSFAISGSEANTSAGTSGRTGLMAKAPVSFVIPKNKMIGSLVPVGGAGVKWENTEKPEDLGKATNTRWGPDLLQDMAVKKGRALAYQTRAEQLAQLLDKGNLEYVDNEEARSPSPEPIYGDAGQRINTKEQRVREAMDIERRKAIGEVVSLNPYYKPPSGWKPVFEEAKLFIPAQRYPGFNFIGLILGPRGNTHRRLEAESGAKIAIRGKGSQKEGKLFRKADGKPPDGADEELHVYISADTIEKVDKAVDMIKPLLEPTDEIANEHKRKQLHELAVINGLVRFDVACSICGEKGHRDFNCPQAGSQFKAKVTCRICGDGGHPTADCPRREGMMNGPAMDKEYMSFLEELGGGVAAIPAPSSEAQNRPPQGTPMGPPQMHTRQGIGFSAPAPPALPSQITPQEYQKKLALISQFGTESERLELISKYGSPAEPSKLDLIAKYGSSNEAEKIDLIAKYGSETFAGTAPPFYPPAATPPSAPPPSQHFVPPPPPAEDQTQPPLPPPQDPPPLPYQIPQPSQGYAYQPQTSAQGYQQRPSFQQPPQGAPWAQQAWGAASPQPWNQPQMSQQPWQSQPAQPWQSQTPQPWQHHVVPQATSPLLLIQQEQMRQQQMGAQQIRAQLFSQQQQQVGADQIRAQMYGQQPQGQMQMPMQPSFGMQRSPAGGGFAQPGVPPGASVEAPRAPDAKLQAEYDSLMADIGIT